MLFRRTVEDGPALFLHRIATLFKRFERGGFNHSWVAFPGPPSVVIMLAVNNDHLLVLGQDTLREICLPATGRTNEDNPVGGFWQSAHRCSPVAQPVPQCPSSSSPPPRTNRVPHGQAITSGCAV